MQIRFRLPCVTIFTILYMATVKSKERKSVLIHSADLLQSCDRHPRYRGRFDLVHSLITAYELDKNISVIAPRKTDWNDLLTFHSAAYIEFIRNYGNHDIDDLSESESEEAELFGLGYDCPLFDGLCEFVLSTAASSLTGAEVLVNGGADVVVNWYGGWHHTHRDQAGGFCYVNDIVLAILTLLDTYERVLYIDVDIHHGDGVEEAFYHSSRVMTVSFHKQAPGFFPGTGDLTSTGSGSGRFHTVNVPLKDGLRDQTFNKLFTRILSDVKSCFNPCAIVMQCGADMLSGDPIGTFSLTPRGLGDNIQLVLEWGLPTLLLGGGGYHFPNTARFWTLCTGLVLGKILTNEIPEHEQFKHYGPDFELMVTPGNRPDENTSKYIEQVVQTISAQLSNI